MKSSVCPMCKGARAPAGSNSAYPFCSARCKLADLSNWFDERYAVPAEQAPLDRSAEADEPSSDVPPTLN